MLIRDIKRILGYFNDDENCDLVECRYNGGGDEYHETDFVFALSNGGLSIIPVEDIPYMTYGFDGFEILDPDTL